MPFVTSEDIRAQQAQVAARAARLQYALDRTQQIADESSDVLPARSAYYLSGLRETLQDALRATADAAQTLEVVLARTVKEEADGISDPVTGRPLGGVGRKERDARLPRE